MYILCGNDKTLVNFDMCNQAFVIDKGDAVMISANYQGQYITLGKYETMKFAMDTLRDISAAIARKESVYYMPCEFFDREEAKKYDARIKRKGGS